jgi:hypothetical protein
MASRHETVGELERIEEAGGRRGVGFAKKPVQSLRRSTTVSLTVQFEGAAWSMKVGTIRSPWCYDAATCHIGNSATACDLALCLKGGGCLPDFACQSG